MRQTIQNKYNQSQFKNPNYLRLLQNLQKGKQQLTTYSHDGYYRLEQQTLNKNQSTEQLWNIYQLGIYRTDYMMGKVREQIDIFDKQLKKMQTAIKLKKCIKALKQKQLMDLKSLNKVCKQTQQQMTAHYNKTINEINSSQVKKNQLLLKINQKNSKSNKIQENNKAYDRRIFKSNRLSDWLLSNSNEKESIFKQIQINGDTQQIIFRIESEKIYEFVLVWDEPEDRFLLKNSHQRLNSMDILAVKCFNIHQNPIKLLTELRKIVQTNIQNSI